MPKLFPRGSVLVLVFVVFLFDARDARSQASAIQAPATPQTGAATAVTATSVVVNGAVGVPGESRSFEAKLTRFNGTPLVGKTVILRFAGPTDPSKKQVAVTSGSAWTDGAGVARFAKRLPVFAAGQYRVEAVFEGESNLAPSTGSNSLGIAKGVGRIEFGPLAQTAMGVRCAITVTLRRTSDNSVHNAPGTFIGRMVTTPTEPLPAMVASAATRWKGGANSLRVVFAGDDTMQPVEATFDPPAGGCSSANN